MRTLMNKINELILSKIETNSEREQTGRQLWWEVLGRGHGEIEQKRGKKNRKNSWITVW